MFTDGWTASQIVILSPRSGVSNIVSPIFETTFMQVSGNLFLPFSSLTPFVPLIFLNFKIVVTELFREL